MSELDIKELMAKLDALAPIILKLADVAQGPQLDSEKGNPDVPFDPKAWRGASFRGRPFSEAPSEFLDMLGDFFEWSSKNPKDGKEQFAGSDRRKASLAYGWAYRKRTGGEMPARKASTQRTASGGPRQSAGSYGGNNSAAPPPTDDFNYGGNDDEIPF